MKTDLGGVVMYLARFVPALVLVLTLTGCATEGFEVSAKGTLFTMVGAGIVAPAALAVKDVVICSHMDYVKEQGEIKGQESNGRTNAQMRAEQYCAQ